MSTSTRFGDRDARPHPIRETSIRTVRLRFAALEAGDPGAPLALCLHGFPDSAWTWRHLLPALADRGYHGVAPFMRGYAPTELPSGGFGLGDLAADVLALEETCRGSVRSVCIGHDWGAAAVYAVLGRSADRWACAVTAAVPPMGDAALDSFSSAQLRRSWYSFLFQLPDVNVPERLASDDDLALIGSLWRDWSPGWHSLEDLARAKAALRPPGHLRAAISYYREVPTRAPAPDANREREIPGWAVPLLYLHGRNDGCIGVDVVEAVRLRLSSSVAVEVLEGAGHFPQLERPEAFRERVLEFLEAHA